MGARRTQEEWAGLLAEFEASGETVERFCARRRIRGASLRWWRWRLRSERSREAMTKPEVRLVPVDVVGAALGRPPTVAIAICGAELRVEVGTDVEYVGALVSALRARC